MSKEHFEKLLKEKKKEEMIKVAYTRKINIQYDLLKEWDTGKISGLECIEGIEAEGKLFRIDGDLIAYTNAQREKPNG